MKAVSFTAPVHPPAPAGLAFQLGATICDAAAESLGLWGRWVDTCELRDQDLAVASYVLARGRAGESAFIRSRRRDCGELAAALAAVVPLGWAMAGYEMRILSTWMAVADGATAEASEERAFGVVGRIDVAARVARREAAELLDALEWSGRPGPGHYQGQVYTARWCIHCCETQAKGHNRNCVWPRWRSRLLELDAPRHRGGG